MIEEILKIPDSLTYETILGQIPSKANCYQAVPDNQGGRRMNGHSASNAPSTGTNA